MDLKINDVCHCEFVFSDALKYKSVWPPSWKLRIDLGTFERFITETSPYKKYPRFAPNI